MGSWGTEEYTVDKLNSEIIAKNITIPKYQRGAVWNKQQKTKLIDSMINGFPFGSILLYRDNDKRQIIDGLQRSTTIIEFVKNPAAFFTDDYLSEDKIDKIILDFDVVSDKSIVKSKLEDIIKRWIVDNHKTMREIERMQYIGLVDEIINEFPTAANRRNSIIDSIKSILTSFQDICEKIADVKIPALVYEGDESLLPEIFERINSQGAKLTKQQIYAASWANDYVKVKSPELDDIILYNKERYENMLDENMELEDYDPVELNRIREVNIFELVFGFGKMISKKYPYLFTFDEENKTKVESIGFNLINACLCQKSADMKNLNNNLKKYIGLTSEKIYEFLNEIIECIEIVDKRLSKCTKFKLNSRSTSKITPLHTEMQIVSIIATVFILKHVECRFDDKGDLEDMRVVCSEHMERWKRTKSTFDKNILKVYAMDILGQKWKGSGDKKLDNIISDNYYYNREVTWDEFEQILDVYYSTINSERNERKQVTSPKEAEKLILSMIYSSIFSAADQTDGSNYDIEHLAPKNLMKEKICAYSEDFRLPVSSIANLCLLPEYDNRVKKDKTIYQDQKYLYSIKNINEIEKKYTFTIKSDLAWLDDDLDEDQFKDAYYKFLDSRFEKMKGKIKENLFTSNYR